MSADGVLNDFLAREKKDLYGLESDLNFLPNGDNNGSEHPKVNDEPECIRRWAISFQKRIDVKDDAERKSLSVLEEQGLKDLHDWALQYRDSLSRGQKLSRAHDKELRSAQKKAAEASVGMAQVDAEGTNTQTVPTNTKDNQRDLNRMRVLLLQLKKNPPAVQSNIRFH
ncbi:Clathrin light chain [Schistosoma japonicum]|nr:Clathrin light chain [Schistosoma japonicum]